MIVSDSDLNLHLTEFITNSVSVLSRDHFACFKNLFRYGFRFSELKYLHTADINIDGDYEFYTLKNNNKRIYHLADIEDNILFQIAEDYDSSSTLSRQTYIRIFQSINHRRKYRIGNKDSSLHIFRHNRIKQMWLDGKTVDQIKAFTGLTQNSTVNRYINSTVEIYY